MLTLRPGSHVHLLVQTLAVTGEYPLCSLGLLGKERVLREVVRRGTEPQLIRNPQTGEEVRTKLFVLNGKGREKSLRLYKGALSLLHWLHPAAHGYYMDSFWEHHFPGDTAHRDRNHRVAEAVALCMSAGVEVLPYDLPRLQREKIRKVTPAFPSLYLGRDIKKAFPGEEKKTLFTRTVGSLFYPGGCYAVYNARNAAMKWRGMGEFKALHSLTEVARLNGGVEQLDGALLLGQSYQVALETLSASQQDRREFRFDGIYPHIHFIPLDRFGARLLGLLIQPHWQERLLDLLFEPADRTFGLGVMEYDAQVEGVKIFSHLDGDIARLLRFKEALWGRPGKFEVLCFPQQAEFVGEILAGMAKVKVIELNAVEEGM